MCCTQGCGGCSRCSAAEFITARFCSRSALAAKCRVWYKLEGPDCTKIQVGLSADEMRSLDAITLEQLLVLLKRAQLQTRQDASKYVGVSQAHSGRWRAQYRCRDRSGLRRCAVFDTEDQAARAYDRWALQELGR